MTETKKPRRKRGALPDAAPIPVREPGNPAPVGDNNPPEPTPLEAFTAHVNDLFEEAKNWLDGEPISNDDQAAQVTKLKNMLAQAEKEADAARAAAKAPFLEAGRKVDADWKPVIERAKKARTTAQSALTPWLEMIEAENRRKALEAQAEARAAAERLREQAIAERASATLGDEDVRDKLERDAKEAERNAARLAKESATVRTEHGGASLRTIWLVKVENRRDLLTHYLKTNPEAIEDFIRGLAEKDVRAGARVLPGCSIWHEKRAI